MRWLKSREMARVLRSRFSNSYQPGLRDESEQLKDTLRGNKIRKQLNSRTSSNWKSKTKWWKDRPRLESRNDRSNQTALGWNSFSECKSRGAAQPNLQWKQTMGVSRTSLPTQRRRQATTADVQNLRMLMEKMSDALGKFVSSHNDF